MDQISRLAQHHLLCCFESFCRCLLTSRLIPKARCSIRHTIAAPGLLRCRTSCPQRIYQPIKLICVACKRQGLLSDLKWSSGGDPIGYWYDPAHCQISTTCSKKPVEPPKLGPCMRQDLAWLPDHVPLPDLPPVLPRPCDLLQALPGACCERLSILVMGTPRPHRESGMTVGRTVVYVGTVLYLSARSSPRSMLTVADCASALCLGPARCCWTTGLKWLCWAQALC